MARDRPLAGAGPVQASGTEPVLIPPAVSVVGMPYGIFRLNTSGRLTLG